jgi:hypothetical protein
VILELVTSAQATLPSPIEAGEVMRDLEGDKLLYFVLIFIVITQLLVIIWAFSKLSTAVASMSSIREAIKALSDTTQIASTRAQDNSLALQSIEQATVRIETKLDKD